MTPKAEFKNALAYFLKEAKAAPVQVRSLPAVEAERAILKEIDDVGKPLRLKYQIL